LTKKDEEGDDLRSQRSTIDNKIGGKKNAKELEKLNK
jgi:hypothetical protein